MTGADDPIAAVTHPNPYPYYADLVAHRPLYHDATLGLWVASSAEAVTAVLTSDLGRVRPLEEPVPTALRGTPAGTVFQHMVRFNDGAGQCPMKAAATAALGTIAATSAGARSAVWARALAERLEPTRDPGHLSRYAFQLPSYVVASLLGVPDALLPQTAAWAGDFARCLAPGSSAEQVAWGTVAAGQLLALFEALVPSLRDDSDSAATLLALLAQEARRVGCDATELIVANAIGFLFQAYDATAGLIGNAVLALATNPAAHARVVAQPGLLNDVLDEVLRYDPSIQNTRRFVASDGDVAGQTMQAGDAILVVLAAANRDPSANPRPERFEILRDDRRLFTFGAGAHACPGIALATTIARAGLAQLLALEADPAQLALPARYRPSHNVRIALAPMAGDV